MSLSLRPRCSAISTAGANFLQPHRVLQQLVGDSPVSLPFLASKVLIATPPNSKNGSQPHENKGEHIS
jgi:hypothetical protein